MFWWFHHPCKPTIPAGDIYLLNVKLTPDKVIHFEDLEFIIDRSDNSSLTPEGVTSVL
jgi:hypothetical protein